MQLIGHKEDNHNYQKRGGAVATCHYNTTDTVIGIAEVARDARRRITIDRFWLKVDQVRTGHVQQNYPYYLIFFDIFYFVNC